MDGRRFDHVIVIQHQDQRVGEGCDLVDQRRQQRFSRRGLWGTERARQVLAQLRRDGLQRGDEVAHKAGGVLVTGVEREPCHASGQGVAPRPIAQQGGLAKASLGGDQREPAPQPGV